MRRLKKLGGSENENASIEMQALQTRMDTPEAAKAEGVSDLQTHNMGEGPEKEEGITRL